MEHASSHVFLDSFKSFLWTRNGDNSQIFFYVNATVVECEEGPKVVLKWVLNIFLSIEWLLNSMQKNPNGSLSIICRCDWERAKLVALWWCWRAWILFCYNVLSPKQCCPATIECAPNHSCYDGGPWFALLWWSGFHHWPWEGELRWELMEAVGCSPPPPLPPVCLTYY